MLTKLASLLIPTLIVAANSTAQPAAGGKTALLQVQNAILSTREGHQAIEALRARYTARKADLEKRQTEVNGLQEQLQKGAATLSDDAQRKLAREVDKKSKALTYDLEVSQADYDEDQTDALQPVERKFRAVLDKYAKDNGFNLILDIGNPQTPAYWWANAIDITNEMIRVYDAAYPAPSSGK